jgi:hypothetical protein
MEFTTMARPEVTGKKPTTDDGQIDAYDIPTFCKRHGGMSESFFHKLRAIGLGPCVMRVGNRVMVSKEAAAAWRAEREAAAQQQEASAA